MPSAGRLQYLEALPPPDARPRGTLLLLHAFPLSARMWEPQLTLASGGWRILAPHFRGFAGTAAEPPAKTIDDFVGDVVDFLDALHIEDAVVGGLSMGGYVALAMFRRAPTYFRGLVLADTRSQADTPQGLEGRRKMLEVVAERGPAAVADDMTPKLLGATTQRTQPELAARVRDLILANSAESIAGAVRVMMSRTDSTDLLPTMRMPVLIVVGEEDGLTPPTNSEEMHASIPGSKLVKIPAAGHLSSLEQPLEFNTALAHFLTHQV
ncbi:MAG TPA: alpha/beta fold hydrolase [Vicinamibacterales bacterium]|jgi:pimeloyl-ACP methyl ester carboxylesterase